jgi:hypothetical protein
MGVAPGLFVGVKDLRSHGAAPLLQLQEILDPSSTR